MPVAAAPAGQMQRMRQSRKMRRVIRIMIRWRRMRMRRSGVTRGVGQAEEDECDVEDADGFVGPLS